MLRVLNRFGGAAASSRCLSPNINQAFCPNVLFSSNRQLVVSAIRSTLNTPINIVFKHHYVGQRNYSTNVEKEPNKIRNSVNAVKQGSEQMMSNIAKNRVVQDISELLETMEKRRYNLRMIALGLATFTTFLSYNFIRSWTSEQATVITTQMLDDEKFNDRLDTWIQKRGEVLVTNLTNSPSVQRDVTSLIGTAVIELTTDPQIEQQIQNLFIRIFRSDEIKVAGSTLSSQIVEQLAHAPEYEKFREQIIIYAIREIKRVADDGQVQGAVSDLIWNSVTQIFTGKNKQFALENNNREDP